MSETMKESKLMFPYPQEIGKRAGARTPDAQDFAMTAQAKASCPAAALNLDEMDYYTDLRGRYLSASEEEKVEIEREAGRAYLADHQLHLIGLASLRLASVYVKKAKLIYPTRHAIETVMIRTGIAQAIVTELAEIVADKDLAKGDWTGVMPFDQAQGAERIKI